MLFLEHTSYFYCTQKKMEILSLLNKCHFSVSTDLCGYMIGFKFIFLHSPKPHSPALGLREGGRRSLLGHNKGIQRIGLDPQVLHSSAPHS